ncbi:MULTISPECIES: hypothetical protein [Asticcacaulis]|uniref:hypothetical protein n=1 Tax=Asticcacaulis TaxID=76890 RepID=UPI001AE4DDDB|nr:MULTISPECIES: hypothetical protein [Asticcacaulis]MBP2161070.1 uncharacterized protein (AIM24 family) [Asticcacaulis solisilvae]MDR6802115.1 uncharacterized protein (AIM24 family) [Asticcacaulis sp. BE141]
MRRVATMFFVACVTLLAACGGGGKGGNDSGGGGSGSSSSSANYSNQALSASATATVNLVNNDVTLSWNDTFPASATYEVRTKQADGSFSLTEKIGGAGGNGLRLTWRRSISSTAVYQLYANVDGQSFLLRTSSGATTLIADVPVTLPQIVINQTEPVSGLVTVSLSGGVSYPKVEWYADSTKIGDGGAGPGNSFDWSTGTSTEGLHPVMARIQTSSDTTLEIGRNVQVANGGVGAVYFVENGAIYVKATSPADIATVYLSIDGGPVTTLSMRNGCREGEVCQGPSLTSYRFSTQGLASGSHSATLTVTDKAAQTVTSSFLFFIVNAPRISLSSPLDGDLAFGTLSIKGASTSDRGETITTTVKLQDVQIFQTTESNYTTNYDISGLAAGTYTLSVQAMDASGKSSVLNSTITVTTSSSTRPEKVFAMGIESEMLAGTGDVIVYRSGSDSEIRLHNVVTNSSVVLADARSLAYATDWTIQNGYVFAMGRGEDCLAYSCAYKWSTDGSITNLSSLAPGYTPLVHQGGLIAKSGYVLWSVYSGVGGEDLVLYNISANTFTKIRAHSGNFGYDLLVSGENVDVFFWTSSAFAIHKWASVDNTITAITDGSIKSLYPQVSADRVVWLEGETRLAGVPLMGGGKVVYAEEVGTYGLDGSVLAWEDRTNNQRTVKISIGGLTTQISNSFGPGLYRVDSGYVVFSDGGKFYTWQVATGKKTLILDSVPTSRKFTGDGKLYFHNASGSVYRVDLN